MKVKTNAQIKIYHHEGTDQTTIRSNANALSIALSRLDNPWAIAFAEPCALTGYCFTERHEAIVLPEFDRVAYTRFTRDSGTVLVPNPLILSLIH